MSAESTFLTTMQAAGAVTAIVGTGSSVRIYPGAVPQDKSMPCIGYQRTATEITSTLSQAATDSRATLEVYCMATTSEGASALGDAVQAASAAAWFVPTSRQSVYDDERNEWADVLTLDYWE